MYNLHFLQANIGNNIVIKQVVNFFSNPYEEEFDFECCIKRKKMVTENSKKLWEIRNQFFFFSNRILLICNSKYLNVFIFWKLNQVNW